MMEALSGRQVDSGNKNWIEISYKNKQPLTTIKGQVVLGSLWSMSGDSGGVMGPLGAILGPLGSVLGPFGGVSGGNWGSLGAS